MPGPRMKNDALLLLAALIWGFAFVAQRVGMETIGPFIFNAIRFALGTLALLPWLLVTSGVKTDAAVGKTRPGVPLFLCIAAGLAIFAGSSLQQIGLVTTTAGKAGFITGLYVIFVPLFGYFLRRPPLLQHWFGASAAIIGLYLLCITERLAFEEGDVLVLASAVFFAIHVHILSYLTRTCNAIIISIIQFSVCSVLSFIFSFCLESTSWSAILQTTLPLLYGGLFSVGIAYTLQVIAQKKAHPSHAAIILSLEALFAALGGWLLLAETLTGRAIVGCLLMLGGMIISQTRLTKTGAVANPE